MIKTITLIAAILISSLSFSQDDLGDKIQNPVANLVSLPFQNNTDFDEKILHV